VATAPSGTVALTSIIWITISAGTMPLLALMHSLDRVMLLLTDL
jgi:hypothetical protein